VIAAEVEVPVTAAPAKVSTTDAQPIEAKAAVALVKPVQAATKKVAAKRVVKK
jgi:hypothetical protein